jgi:hypothetical protein
MYLCVSWVHSAEHCFWPRPLVHKKLKLRKTASLVKLHHLVNLNKKRPVKCKSKKENDGDNNGNLVVSLKKKIKKLI